MGVAHDKVKCAQKTVLSWTKSSSKWPETILSPCSYDDDHKIHKDELRPKAPDVVIILANADSCRNCEWCRDAFTSVLQLPHMWWSGYSRRSNGHFGCEVVSNGNENGQTASVVSWARFQVKYLNSMDDYTWEKLNTIVHWSSSKGKIRTTIVIFDARERLYKLVMPSLKRSVESVTDATTFQDPFWSYEGLLEGVVDLHNDSVWRLRTLLRTTEKAREVSSIASRPDFPLLHDLARHALHVTETLDVAVTVMTAMLAQHDSTIRGLEAKNTPPASRHLTTHGRLLFYQNIFDNLRHRSTSNQQRVQNEIQLAFNMVAQRDTSLSLELTHAMRQDSTAMRTIAVLTLTFFPATFIAAIFSTSFFGILDDGTWVMSDNFWMYWAFAIPVTLGTAALWAYLKDGLPRHVKPARVTTNEGC